MQLWHSPLEFFQFIEEMLRVIEGDFFFNWPRSR